MVDAKLKIDLKTKDGTVTPAGTEVGVVFRNGIAVVLIGDREVRMRVTRLAKYCTGFTKEPSLATLEKWNEAGYCLTVTGRKTEPDGYGSDGSPSWLLALGVI